jgi:hypothetical protein
MSNYEPRTPAPPVVPPVGTPSAPITPPVTDAGGETGGGGAADRGKQVAGTAKEETKQVAGTAADQGKQVAATAAAGAKDVVGEAKREAADVARTATDEARRMFGEVSGELRTQAGGQTDKLAEGLKALGGQLSSAASGQPLEEGMVRDLAQQAGTKVNDIAERLSSGGVEGVVDDVTLFARRRPGLFLAGAATAGFLAGRLLRGAQADAQSSSRPAPSPYRTTPAPVADVPPMAVVPPVSDLTTGVPAPLDPEPTGVIIIDDGPTTGLPTVPPGTLPADGPIGNR